MRYLLSRISFDGLENTSDGNLKSHLNGRPPYWRGNLDSMGSRSIKSRRSGSSRTRIVAITTRCSPCMRAVCLSGGVDTIRTLIAFLAFDLAGVATGVRVPAGGGNVMPEA